MHCYICDKQDDQIQFDRATQSFGPCPVCLAIIAECVADFEEPEDKEFDDD
jgi:hypothetical protein